MVQGINSQFPGLLPERSTEDKGPENEGDVPEGDTQDSTDNFSEKWGWLAAVDAVSETYRASWDVVYKLPVIEFLNILCYRKDKIAKEKADLEKWKKTH